MAARPPYQGTPPPSGAASSGPQRYPGPQGTPGAPMRFSQPGYQVKKLIFIVLETECVIQDFFYLMPVCQSSDKICWNLTIIKKKNSKTHFIQF